jgi:polyribonucleotide nucleotidyltransferase
VLAIREIIQYGEHKLTIETGVIARQANGSVIVDMDGTVVLCTVVGNSEPGEEKNFFPLRVDYQERSYASGKIPGGFFKREGRPTEREILISRLIDRPIRPMFPKGFTNEVQVIASLISLNPEIEADIPAMIGASAALSISGIPFEEPMGAARVGYIDGKYILNPTQEQLKHSKLDLVVAGTSTSVLMVESEAQELSESVMLGAVMFGHRNFQSVITAINELKVKVNIKALDWQPPVENAELVAIVRDEFSDAITQAYCISDKIKRHNALKNIREVISTKFVNEDDIENEDFITYVEVMRIIENLEKEIVRGKILRGEPRIDGRDVKMIRPISIQTGILPRTHGSALFTRGETQSLTTVTLGTGKDAQLLDHPFGETKENFMLHYNFLPFCVGEIGQMGSPKRREIGHGRLAKRGLQAVFPTMEQFPYVIRVVSEITESNGSSSMATVCAGSLALMDAGVPISAPVAGIAMGLIKDQHQFVVLSDIIGVEDHLGDMDFKVAGTSNGVTALQMDIKINGITEEIMAIALQQAYAGRMHILGIMNESINTPKRDISSFAPRIISFNIDQDKIKDVIGKGGATIRGLLENTNGATIDIQEDGTVQIATANLSIGNELRKKIETIIAEVEIGSVYEGKVVRIVDFGAFVNILPGKDGLLHISQIAKHRVVNVTDELHEGQLVKVKVLEIDRQGRIKLSMKAMDYVD